ncbi:MAG TPA: amidohydrolase family protein [Xanthobacteraceae bacterium]|nr:amidohydrolase family protein [Xanthobacteraceae bacterium]
MPTRRAMLLGGIAMGVAMRGGSALANASQPATAVNFDLPSGACDCHTHIFGDPQKFPFFAGRVYTPEPASPEEMAALHKSLHIERVVIVTPSVYGTDNSATLYGMKARGATARGVAVIDDKTPESELDAMNAAGIRGIRINLATGGITDPAVARLRLQAAIDRAKGHNWHVQIYSNLPVIAALKSELAQSPVPLVLDHFAGAQAALGVDQPGFADVVELVRNGKTYVKISGAYRASKAAPDYADVLPFAKALIAANPDRLVWGTDWPHPDAVTPPGKKPTDVTPLLQIDDGRLLNLLAVWTPDAAIRQRILVANPARLYGFDA